MVTVAVTGVSTPLGSAVVARLDGDPEVDRIIGVDLRPPHTVSAKLDVRLADVRGPGVAALIAGAHAVVHLGTVPSGADQGTRFATAVGGTRNLLAAAAAVGASTFVQMSSAMAYGAHPDNPVPLGENAPLRAHPGFAPGHHAVLAEELVAAFAADHPEARTVVLRPAPLLGQTDESPLLRHLESPLLAQVSDHYPPLQFCDLGDLAHAIHLAVSGDESFRGAYNVASDGWLTAAELSRLLGRPRFHLPQAPASVLADLLADLGLLESGTPWIHFLMYPWVVDTRALQARGWSATRSNRELVRSFVAEHHDVWRLGPLRVSRRRLALGATAATTAAGVLATALAWYLLRRWRRRR
jgi:nucleoside-diphosphate-sugar epimerase